jgi:hypothetical protein
MPSGPVALRGLTRLNVLLMSAAVKESLHVLVAGHISGTVLSSKRAKKLFSLPGSKTSWSVTFGIQAKELHFCFRPESIVSHDLGCHVHFTEKWPPSGPSPSGRFSHLHRGTLELCQSDDWFLVTSLTKALLSLLLSLAGRPALGRVLVVPNFFHLRMMEATVFLGTFNAADICWYPFPNVCLYTTLFQSSNGQFPSPHGLVFALLAMVPYIDRCVPFQIMSNQLNTPQLDSNQVVETSR